MNKREFKDYEKICINILRLENDIEELITQAEKCTTELSDMPKGNNNKSRLEEYVVAIDELKGELIEERRELIQQRQKIEAVIKVLPEREKCLMRLKYIDCLSWEEICVKMNYSWRQIHYIHSDCLKLIEKSLH
jgi:DNA-directed RNA polymerase specialized sigma subunit